VVLVSFDGFRHDFRELHSTPNLDRIAASGVVAESLIPTFPTKTFPAHYSMATGLYPERHGLVGNRFYDPARGESYDLADRETVEDGSWYGGEPIWALAERQGMVAAAYFWVGTEADPGGVRPTHWYPFNAETPPEARVDQVLEWLSEPEETRPHLITLYFEDVDIAAHDRGPRAPETAAAVARVDSMAGRLVKGVEALPHGDRVYLVFVSDHGHAEWTAERAARIDVARYPGVKMVGDGTYAGFFLPPGETHRARAVRDSIQGEVGETVRVYLREELPERLHVAGTPRFGDVVALADPGVLVVPADWNPVRRRGSTHGWDNQMPEMGALFLARGPGLPRGRRIPPLDAVDVYPFVAHVLGLEPPPVDGRLEPLGRLLEKGGSGSGLRP
jgi:predicted AlkP superfamily pyrophosphatase or phosphodiesterase